MKKTGLKYEDALLLFEQKKYNEANELLVKLYSENDGNPEISYFLGIVKSKLGEYENAISLFEKFILANSKHIEALYNLALCYHKINQYEKALDFYKRAVEINPFLSEAFNNMAIIYREMNNIEEAEKCYRHAIRSKPGNSNAASNLANLTIDKHHSKEYSEAVSYFENKEYSKALKILLKLQEKDSKNIDLLNSLGILYHSLNEYEKSIDCFKKIVELNENSDTAYYSIGVCYQALENLEESLTCYKKAIEINPRNLDALNNLGLLYAGLKKNDEAEKCYLQAIKHKPDYFFSITNLGSLKVNEDKYEEAKILLDKALEIAGKQENKSNLSVAYGNLGFICIRQKKLNEALDYLNTALKVNPENTLAHYNKAELLFLSGRLEEAWAEYEWRTGRKDFGKRHFDKPLPKDQDIKGKRVLVYAEQGIGDALQFIRYIPMLKAKGCYIIFECEKSIFGLIKNFSEIDELIERNVLESPNIDYDYEIPLLSLPLYFNTSLSTIPADVPYISFEEKYREKWTNIIGNSKEYKIGIVWAGSPIHTNDRNRSTRLKEFMPLFSIEGTKFYSLQKGFPLVQSKDYQLFLTNLDDFELQSFSDTAAAIDNLDLVITVDTSVAHLTGALGKKVWVLLPYIPDWRWMIDRTDSPWYPTMKLYRQPEAGDWASVFKQVRTDIMKEMNNQSSSINKMNNNHYKRFTDFLKKIEGETYPETPSSAHTEITRQAIDDLLEKFPINTKAKILDIGCGQGPALDYFKELGFDPIGITLNDEDVKVCRSKGHEVYKMDQSFLEFEDKSFDLIWVRHCLEHSIAPYFTLSEFFRVSKPGALIYIEVPAPDTDAHHETNPNHYSVLTQSMWSSLIQRSGFSLLDGKIYKLSMSKVPDGKDEYWAFIGQNQVISGIKNNKEADTLYVGLSSGDNFGWGVCSKYLKKELSKKLNIISLDENEELLKQGNVNGKVLHALINKDFSGLFALRGTENYGYTFFEYELSKEAIINAKNYNFIIGGSTWNKEKLESYGINNAEVLVQGIDPKLFYPGEKEKNTDLFIIFSGGKFEIRKGQDLVLKAVKILQQKYKDIILINAWYNIWPETIKSMAISRHINFEMKGDTWKNFMINLCQINGIDGNKVFTLPLTPNDKLRDLYLSSDIGLFPNRCEGGTNLVLMEYMACGRPVIASYTSGHKDILTENNSIPLKQMHEFKLYDEGQGLIADWQEPDIDEIVEKIEYAYNNRDEIKKIGKNAGEFMQKLTWTESAEKLLKILYQS